MSQYQPVSNGQVRSRPDPENFRLLSITESSEEDTELKRRHSPKDNKVSSNPPDLKLNIPKGSSNKVMSAAGKIRRKIRLKRKQRDRLNNGMHHQSVTSTSETGGSELEDEYCSPVDVCLACMPMETLRCCTCQGRNSNSSKTHRQLWLHALILFVFAVALAGLAYYSMTLQNQLAVLSMHLDPVLDEKSSLAKGQEQFGNQLTSLAKNQSILQDNLTSILVTIEALTSQIKALNTSMTSVLPSLSEGPKLKTIPSEISEIKKDLAQLGSQIIEIDSQVSKTTNDLHVVHQTLNSIPNQTNQELNINQAALEKLSKYWNQKLLNETSIMDDKIEENNGKFKIVAANLTEQIQRQELHSKNAWELLETLNNNVQNVSAKAISNEMLSRANHAKIAKLEEENSKTLSSSSMNNPSPQNHL
eukprot:01729.XXX_707_3867_1 [CDS] Oithona nana genome sequencing.